MVSSQGTSVSSNHKIYSFSNTISYSTFYAFFSDNIMADVASSGIPGGVGGFKPPPPEIPNALKIRAKLNPIMKT